MSMRSLYFRKEVKIPREKLKIWHAPTEHKNVPRNPRRRQSIFCTGPGYGLAPGAGVETGEKLASYVGHRQLLPVIDVRDGRFTLRHVMVVLDVVA